MTTQSPRPIKGPSECANHRLLALCGGIGGIAGLSTAFGFGMSWYMWWLAAIALIGFVVVSTVHTFNYDRDDYMPVTEAGAKESILVAS